MSDFRVSFCLGNVLALFSLFSHHKNASLDDLGLTPLGNLLLHKPLGIGGTLFFFFTPPLLAHSLVRSLKVKNPQPRFKIQGFTVLVEWVLGVMPFFGHFEQMASSDLSFCNTGEVEKCLFASSGVEIVFRKI